MAEIGRVYVLKPFLTDPRFNGCVFSSKARSVLGFDNPIRDFLPADGESLQWQPLHLASKWRAQPCDGPANSFNDYPCLELSIPVFSKSAVSALGEMLTQNGELLPLKTKVGQYWAFNVTTKLIALDLRKSILRRTDDFTTAIAIKYFAFVKSKLRNASIFRIQEHPNLYLVTHRFKQAADSAGLNGFNFIEVWPLPEGTDWKVEEAARRKKSDAVKLVGQALILRFRLKKVRPSPREKKLGVEIKDALAAKLTLDSLSQKYRGSIDVAEFEEGEFRLFCTCPDCEDLAEYLADWFEQVPWENDFDIVKRFGNLNDTKAKEKRIVIRRESS